MIACETIVSFTFLCLSVVTDTVTGKAQHFSQEIFHMVGKKYLCRGCFKNNTLSTSRLLSLNLFAQREILIQAKHIWELLPGNFSTATKQKDKDNRNVTLVCLIKHHAGSVVLRRECLLSFCAFRAGWKWVDRCKLMHLYRPYPLDRRLYVSSG
jgi:hypothetical protein